MSNFNDQEKEALKQVLDFLESRTFDPKILILTLEIAVAKAIVELGKPGYEEKIFETFCQNSKLSLEDFLKTKRMCIN